MSKMMDFYGVSVSFKISVSFKGMTIFLTLAGWFIFFIFHFLVAEKDMQLLGSKGEELIFKAPLLESWKHIMVWVGRDFTNPLVPFLCNGQGHLSPDQVSPSPGLI